MRRLAITALSTALSFAAMPPASNAMARQPAQMPNPIAEPSLTVEFAGGTVAQYIDSLKKSGKAVNVVASERASKQPLSPISLSQVTVGVAVYAIQAASTSATGSWRIDAISGPGPRMTPYAMAGDAFAVDFFPYGKRGEDVVVESYSLQKILRADGKGGGFDSKVVLTAIETGLKLQNEGGEQPPDLQFHADSGLLFVRGTNAEVRLVGSIVSRLSEDAKVRTAASDRRAQASMIRTIATKEATLEVQLQEAELNSTTRALEQARQLSEKGSTPASEVSRLELEVARARFKLERAKLGLERAQIVASDPLDAEESDRPAEAPDEAPQRTQPVPAPGKSTKRPGSK
jgi:hypothetical protein